MSTGNTPDLMNSIVNSGSKETPSKGVHQRQPMRFFTRLVSSTRLQVTASKAAQFHLRGWLRVQFRPAKPPSSGRLGAFPGEASGWLVWLRRVA